MERDSGENTEGFWEGVKYGARKTVLVATGAALAFGAYSLAKPNEQIISEETTQCAHTTPYETPDFRSPAQVISDKCGETAVDAGRAMDGLLNAPNVADTLHIVAVAENAAYEKCVDEQ
jgi:hypothetical protein